MIKKTSLLLCLAAFLNASPPPVPGGGIIEQQLEKEYEQQPLELRKPLPPFKIDLPKERLKLPAKGSVRVDRIVFEGNESLSSKQLQRVVTPFLGKSLSLEEIYHLCEAIDTLYASKGYFAARAFPPPQSVENRTLLIRIIEGKLGEVKVQGNEFYPTRFIKGYFDSLISKPLNYDRLIRALLLANENTDLHVGAVLSKGKEVGTADLILVVDDKWPGHLYLNANNYGRDLTTNWRTGGRFDVGSLLKYGDKFSVAEVVGFPINALYFTDVVYRIPLNKNGLDLEASYLFSRFKVEELRQLKLGGESNIATLKIKQALKRSQQMSLDLSSWFDYMQIENLQGKKTSSFDKLRVWRIATLFDSFTTPKGRDYLSGKVSFGIPRFLGGLSRVDSSCSRQGAGGLFIKLNADYDHLQRLGESQFLSLHLSGQWGAYRRLPIPEQLYLGGSDTVRGYPLAVALGESGYYTNLEWRVPPPFLGNFKFFMAKAKWREVCQLVGFFDHGGTCVKAGTTTYLAGAGVGLRLNRIIGLDISLDVGFPLMHRRLSRGAVGYIKVTACPF